MMKKRLFLGACCLIVGINISAQASNLKLSDIPEIEKDLSPLQHTSIRIDRPFLISGQLSNYGITGVNFQYNLNEYIATRAGLGYGPHTGQGPSKYGAVAEGGGRIYFSPENISGFGDILIATNGLITGAIGAELRAFSGIMVSIGIGTSYNLVDQQFGTDLGDIPPNLSDSLGVKLNGLTLRLEGGFAF